MARITTRTNFKKYCLRKLGAPVITINVAPDQIDDSVDDALSKFFQNHFDALEEKFFVHTITDQEVTQGYLVMPSDCYSVKKIWTSTNAGGGSLFSATYQIFLEDYMRREGAFSMVGMQDFYITQMHLDLLNYLLAPDIRFNFNKITGRVFMQGIDLSEYQQSLNPVIVQYYKKIADSNGEDSLMWDDIWLKRYATALIKKQWGSNVKKYNGVEIIGGITMNGQQLFDEAVEEIKELEDALEENYSLPVDFLIG